MRTAPPRSACAAARTDDDGKLPKEWASYALHLAGLVALRQSRAKVPSAPLRCASIWRMSIACISRSVSSGGVPGAARSAAPGASVASVKKSAALARSSLCRRPASRRPF